jgi:hypothetical protein
MYNVSSHSIGGPPILRAPDDPVRLSHRAPPAGIANSVVMAMLIMYVRCVSGLGHIMIIS